MRVLAPWCKPFPGYYLYTPSREQMPAKVRALMDFLVGKRERLAADTATHAGTPAASVAPAPRKRRVRRS